MSKFIRVEDLNLWFDVNDLPNFKKLSWAKELPTIDPAEIAERLEKEIKKTWAKGVGSGYYFALKDFLRALEETK